jgi:hypothetical protein
MRVLFLNIDGVLNTGDNLQVAYELWKIRNPGKEHSEDIPSNILYDGMYMDKYGELFDPRAVKWLSFILAKTDAKIVLISPWRINRNVSVMWKNRRLPGKITDIAPNINQDKPAVEIAAWIKENEVESFVVLDAFNNYPDNLEDRLVLVDKNYGLTMKSSLEVLNVLKNK